MSKSVSSTLSSKQNVAINETDELIAAGKVEGTTVFDRKGEKIGSVRDVMIGKRSGKVSYAVLSFGGFLGLGENYYPLPWDKLTYHTAQGGYVVDLDEARIKDAPSYRSGEAPDWNDRDQRQRVDDFYGMAMVGRPIL